MGRIFFKVKESDIERLDYTIIDDSESCCEKELLTTLFDKYNVPEEYRFMFFYKSLINNDIKEFFTDTPLSIIKNYPNGDAYKIKYEKDKQLFHFYVMHNKDNCTKDFIKKFFFRMDENNYMDRYLHAINDYFFLKMDSYSITKVSDSEDFLNDKRRFVNKVIRTNRKTR